MDWQSIVSAAQSLGEDFAGKVVNSILVGGVVAWLLSLGKGRDKRVARAQIAEQMCRVFGMRLYRNRTSKKWVLEQLPSSSLQGWQSLERLQWALDMHRAQLSTGELVTMQALIEDLLRIRANQMTMEYHLLDTYAPQAAKMLLPRRLRAEFLENVPLAVSNLTMTTG